MKTITAGYTDSLKAPTTSFVRQVYYKRRYWVESSKAYTWESNWTQLTEDKVVGCSQVTAQLDIQTLNQFKTSNVTITLANLINQWKPDNPWGIFAKDTTSPVYGYEPHLMKFQIRAGLVRASDAATETVNIFTGVLTDYQMDSSTGSIQLTVSGEETLLIEADAEKVSTTVTNETATGTVDGSNKVFTTTNNGVGIVTEVSDNGITKRAGVDYTLSQLNDPSNPGKMAFTVAPAVGHTVRVSYVYWKQSQKFESLITSLLNQAGIPGGNQQVSPVIFPSNIINTHNWVTQADWQGGSSLTNIDTTTIPNSIQFNYSNAQTWNDSTTGWTTGTALGGNAASFGSDGTGIFFNSSTTHGDVWAYRASTNVYGDWSFSFNFASPGSGSNANKFVVGLVVPAVGAPASPTTQYPWQSALCLIIQSFGNHSGDNINLFVTDSNGASTNGLLGTNQSITFSVTHTIRVRYRPSGKLLLYFDGALIASGDQSSFAGTLPTTSADFGYYFDMRSNADNTKCYLNAGTMGQGSSTTGIGTWISSVVDFGSTPTSWTQYISTQTLNSGALTYYTASSADNITYDAYVVVPANGLVASTLRRYLKVKTIIDITSGDPVVSSITAGAITTSTVVTLANFTGMTCYDAITALGKFANYEFGFDASENFYFRPKSAGTTPAISLDQKTYNLQLKTVVSGNDRVYSTIRATYGIYTVDISDDGNYYAGPKARIGLNRLTVSGGSILISNDADIATGIASSFFGYFKYPRRRVKVATKMLAQMEISDVVQISFVDNLPKGWFIGDTSVTLGTTDPTLNLYGAPEQMVSQMLAKIIGFRIDTDTWQTEFDLEEVV